MVFTAYMSHEIVIDASPEKVRAQFLDFGNLLRYSTRLYRSIRPKRAGTEDPIEAVDAKPGDSLTIATSTGLAPRIDAKLVENSSKAFKYTYTAGGNNATQVFEFLPNREDPGTTVFKQSQTIHGTTAFYYWFWSPWRWILDGQFQGFNEDLKEVIESK